MEYHRMLEQLPFVSSDQFVILHCANVLRFRSTKTHFEQRKKQQLCSVLVRVFADFSWIYVKFIKIILFLRIFDLCLD